MNRAPRLMIVDDDVDMCEMLRDDFAGRGYDVAWETDPERGFDRCMAEAFDVVVTDVRMPRLNGLELCHRLSANRPDLPVIVLTAFGSMDAAVEAIRAGAYDFVSKPVERDLLATAIDRARQHVCLTREVRLLRERRERPQTLDLFVGDSPPMQRMCDEIVRIADQEVPVLITGESGTGKELVARALHGHSTRREGPMVTVNGAALPETLIESEMFGHVRGAFTDAGRDRTGLFQQAHGGTLFIDEIGEIPLSLQPKLLRAFEAGVVRPVGSDHDVPVDVRLVTATNRDLVAAVEEQRFREDLFFRINVVRIEVPALRFRGGDILRLAQHFLEQAAARSGQSITGLAPAVADRLLAYPWPGNVRELRNAMDRAVAMSRFDTVTLDDLPEPIRRDRPHEGAYADHPDGLRPLEEVERAYVMHVLDTVGHNKSLAARVLGLDRATLYRKLERWERRND